MALKDSLRLESIYFNNLKSRMKLLKSWADGESSEETKDILNNCIEADAAILLLYRNLGETWNELTAYIQKEMRDLDDLKQTVDAYHDELNEKIDEVNNYLMVLIRDLQERVTILENKVEALENAVESLDRKVNIIFDLVVEPVAPTRGKKNTKAASETFHLEYESESISYSDIEAIVEAGYERILWVRGVYELMPFSISGLNSYTFKRTTLDEVNSTVNKETVTIDNTDTVTHSYDVCALGGGGTSDMYVCKYNNNSQAGAVTFNVTPQELVNYITGQTGSLVASGFIYDNGYPQEITNLLPAGATYSQDPDYPSFIEFHLYFKDLRGDALYDFYIMMDNGQQVQPPTVIITY